MGGLVLFCFVVLLCFTFLEKDLDIEMLLDFREGQAKHMERQVFTEKVQCKNIPQSRDENHRNQICIRKSLAKAHSPICFQPLSSGFLF